jgi:hypothetical protein
MNACRWFASGQVLLGVEFLAISIFYRSGARIFPDLERNEPCQIIRLSYKFFVEPTHGSELVVYR